MEVMVYVVCVVTLFETEVVLYVLSNIWVSAPSSFLAY